MEHKYTYSCNKGFRLLSIFEHLNKGELIDKQELADSFDVTPKTIQRDIDDLRAYLAEEHNLEGEVAIKYDKGKNAYYLVRFGREWLTNEEVLATCKILLESRAFCKEELQILINKLLTQIVPDNKKLVENIINNELFHYVPLQHGQKLFSKIWELARFINYCEIISIKYTRQDGTNRAYRVKPVAVMFSEFYFYLIGFMADDSKAYPTVFRVDRLQSVKGTKEKFKAPYQNRFSDGEFRKRVQFMYSGELKRLQFRYNGPSVEAILDRLPTAKIIEQTEGDCLIEAEVYGGQGIDMWLKGQGNIL